MIKRKEVLIQAVESGFHETAEGAPLRLDECRGGNAEYEIWGNSGGVGDYDQSCGKYVIPLTAYGKNLIPYPYRNTTKTTNGITFTDNGDGSVTANGTATAKAYFILWMGLENIDTTKKYVLSGSTKNFHVYVQLYQGNTWKREYMSSMGRPIVIEFPTDIEFNRINVSSYVNNGYTANNETIRPQFELGDAATEYEPYTAPKTIELELSSPLSEGEVLSSKADNLPSLTLNNGTNTIIAETEIPPQKISVSYVSKVKN